MPTNSIEAKNGTQASSWMQHCINGDMIRFNIECFFYKSITDLNFALLAILFLAIIFSDIILNMNIIISTLKNKLRKRVDICFMSNAIADLMIGLVVMPCTTVIVLFKHFPFHRHVCFLWHCFDFTCGTVSMLHILFISYDRYLSVSKPLQYTNKSKINDRLVSITRLPTRVVLVSIWILAIFAWVPILFYFNLQRENILNINESSSLLIVHESCEIKFNPYVIVPHSILIYFLPMIFISIFYTYTIKIVKSKIKRRRRKSLLSSSKSKSSHINTNENEEKKFLFFNFHKMLSSLKARSSSNADTSDTLNEDNIDLDSSIILKKFFSKLNYKLSLSENYCETPPSNVNVPNNLNTELSINTSSCLEAEASQLKKQDSINDLFNKVDEMTRNDPNEKSSSTLASHEAIDLCLKIIETNEKLRMKFYLNNNNNFNKKDKLIKLQKTPTISREKKINFLQVPKRQNFISIGNGNEILSSSNKCLKRINSDSISPIITKKIKAENHLRRNPNLIDSNYSSSNENSSNNSYQVFNSDLTNVSMSTHKPNKDNNYNLSKNIASLVPNTVLISLNSSGILTNSKRETYLIYKIGIILVTFILCWLPFSLFWTIDSFCKTCILQEIYYFTFWLAYLNSILTPFILLYTNNHHMKTVFYIQQCFRCLIKNNQSQPKTAKRSLPTK